MATAVTPVVAHALVGASTKMGRDHGSLAAEKAAALYEALPWSIRLIMIRAGKKALLEGWTDEALVERIRQCAEEVALVTPSNPAIKFRVLGQGAQSCVYKVTSLEDLDIPPFALKMEGVFNDDLDHLTDSPAWGFLFEAALAAIGHIWPEVAESWMFSPSYGLAALPVQPRFQADGMTCLQLNLVMKLMEGDMLEWIHGQLHGIKAQATLKPAQRSLLAGTPFGSRVLPAVQLYSLMNEAIIGVRQMHTLGWIHADIKPENMFWMVDESDVMHVYQADMGAAAPIDRPDKRSSSMAWGGTREYMSPSRSARYARRDFTASDADDAYGLGSTMLQMLTGYQPHQDVNAWHACPTIITNLAAHWFPQLATPVGKLGNWAAARASRALAAFDTIKQTGGPGGRLWCTMVEAACVLMAMPELVDRHSKRMTIALVQEMLAARSAGALADCTRSPIGDAVLLRGDLLPAPATMVKLLMRSVGNADLLHQLRELHGDSVEAVLRPTTPQLLLPKHGELRLAPLLSRTTAYKVSSSGISLKDAMGLAASSKAQQPQLVLSKGQQPPLVIPVAAAVVMTSPAPVVATPENNEIDEVERSSSGEEQWRIGTQPLAEVDEEDAFTSCKSPEGMLPQDSAEAAVLASSSFIFDHHAHGIDSERDTSGDRLSRPSPGGMDVVAYVVDDAPASHVDAASAAVLSWSSKRASLPRLPRAATDGGVDLPTQQVDGSSSSSASSSPELKSEQLLGLPPRAKSAPHPGAATEESVALLTRLLASMASTRLRWCLAAMAVVCPLALLLITGLSKPGWMTSNNAGTSSS